MASNYKLETFLCSLQLSDRAYVSGARCIALFRRIRVWPVNPILHNVFVDKLRSSTPASLGLST